MMHFGEWDVWLQRMPASRQVRVYLSKPLPAVGKVQYLLHDGTMKETGEIINLQQADKLWFALMPEDSLKAFASALADEGIKPDRDSHVAGLYEAQSKHLEDMRRLVFEDNEPHIEQRIMPMREID